jgi:hypothetical protein
MGAYRNKASVGIELAIRGSEQFGIPSSLLASSGHWFASRWWGEVEKREKNLW